jgi:hypothetical protein
MGNGISKYLGNGGHYISTKLRRCDYPQKGVVSPEGQNPQPHPCGNVEIRKCKVVSVADSRWPRVLGRWSAAARLLALQVRIPLGAWMSLSFECCVLSGISACAGLIASPGSFRVWCD